MGILTAAGSLARICGPVFVSEIYKVMMMMMMMMMM